MNVNPIVQAAREHKINQVIEATGCTRDVAISYLFAEEWFVADAIISLEGDIKYPYQPAI
jgi:protein associated with RNAse G/E